MEHKTFLGLAPGIWAWIVQFILLFAWIPMDLWLWKSGYELMTTEFREGLRSPLTGVLLVFFLTGSVAAFCFHMFVKFRP